MSDRLKQVFESLKESLGDDLLVGLVDKTLVQLDESIEMGILSLGHEMRLAYLDQVVSCLQESYTNDGIRNWFKRPRKQLKNQSPVEYLSSYNWLPRDDKAREILKLARSTQDSGAT